MWKLGIKFALGADLMDYIVDTEGEPDTVTKKGDFKEWKCNSVKAMNTIGGSLEMQRFGKVSENKKRSAWQKLYDFHAIDGSKTKIFFFSNGMEVHTSS